MKSTIRVCVVYSRDLAGLPMVTHGSVNFREPQPGSEYLQTAKTAINGRRVNNILDYTCATFHVNRSAYLSIPGYACETTGSARRQPDLIHMDRLMHHPEISSVLAEARTHTKSVCSSGDRRSTTEPWRIPNLAPCPFINIKIMKNSVYFYISG